MENFGGGKRRLSIAQNFINFRLQLCKHFDDSQEMEVLVK